MGIFCWGEPGCWVAWLNSPVGAAWAQALLTVFAIAWSVRMARLSIDHDHKSEERRRIEASVQQMKEWAMNLRRAENVCNYASGVLGPLDTEIAEKPFRAYMSYAADELQGCFNQFQVLVLREFQEVEQIKMLNDICISVRAAKMVLDRNVAGDFLDCKLAYAQKELIDKFINRFAKAAADIEEKIKDHAAP